MNTIAISVILPVYNVEPYLSQCIDSLKAQTFKDLEFIFVDDDSSDASLQMIEDFQSEDARVQIIRSKKNKGPGIARNKGIEIAQGQYLSFVDPDDWIDETFYEDLYKKALNSKADIIKGIRVKVLEDKEDMHPSLNLNKHIKKGLQSNKHLYNLFTYEHQSAIYRKELFIKHPWIRYGSTINSEDTTFLFRLCLETQSIAFDDSAKYYYRAGHLSMTHSYTMDRCWHELKALEEKIDAILAHSIDQETYDSFASKINVCGLRFLLAKKTKEEEKAFMDALKKQIIRFPEYPAFIKKHTFLRAIMHYDTFLPREQIEGSLTYLDCLTYWSQFLKTHPHAGWKYDIEFTDIFLYAFLSNKEKTLSILPTRQKIKLFLLSLYRCPRLCVKHIVERF